MKNHKIIKYFILLYILLITSFMGCTDDEEGVVHFLGYHGYLSQFTYGTPLDEDITLTKLNASPDISVSKIRRYSVSTTISFNYYFNNSRTINISNFNNTIFLEKTYTTISISFNSPNMIMEKDIPKNEWDTFIHNITNIQTEEKKKHDKYVNPLIYIIEDILDLPSPASNDTVMEYCYLPS